MLCGSVLCILWILYLRLDPDACAFCLAHLAPLCAGPIVGRSWCQEQGPGKPWSFLMISGDVWCDPYDHLWSSMYDTAWYSNLKHLRLGTISGPWKDFKGPIVRFSSTGVLLLERAFNILQLSSWTVWIWLGSLCEWVLHLEYFNFAWGGWVYGYRDTTGGDAPPCQGARTGLMHSCMLLLGMEYPPILLASSNIILYHPHLLATFIWVRIFPPS